MKPIDTETLAGMTINMLERTAMVLAEPAETGSEQPEATRFARVVFSGPGSGTLVLGATDGFVRELAAGMLGVEPGEVNADSQGNDALKEMANMLGGSVLLALSGETCEYSLGLPETINPKAALVTPSAECTVVAEGGVLHVQFVDGSLARAA